jgi:hypothetical protein
MTGQQCITEVSSDNPCSILTPVLMLLTFQATFTLLSLISKRSFHSSRNVTQAIRCLNALKCIGRKRYSCDRLWRLMGCEKSWLPYFPDNRLTVGGKAVSRTCRTPFIPRKIPGTHFCESLSRAQGHTAAGRIRSIGTY